MVTQKLTKLSKNYNTVGMLMVQDQSVEPLAIIWDMNVCPLLQDL